MMRSSRNLPRLASSSAPLGRYRTCTHLKKRKRNLTTQNAPKTNFEDTAAVHPPRDAFCLRHIGPSAADQNRMLRQINPSYTGLSDLIADTVPADIRQKSPLTFEATESLKESRRYSKGYGVPEYTALKKLFTMASKNKLNLNFQGCGYYGTLVPNVIQRNVLENPGWYTSYTPYQAEISQGRMESLLNFQTMVSDLTALPIANASLLDEGTAAAEAMALSLSSLPLSRQKRQRKTFLVSSMCHPQTINVLKSRAEGLGIELWIVNLEEDRWSNAIQKQGDDLIGVLVQYPDTFGAVQDYQPLAKIVHESGGTFCVATDLLALTMLKPPGEFGADIAVGSSQRLGVPMGYGGPHAAFFACSEQYKRKIPGRIIGVSKDRLGNPAFRLALQTREQHIRREKATSNICTAQALLANMSAFYAIYHGAAGLRNIAQRIRRHACRVSQALEYAGFDVEKRGVQVENSFSGFDTISLKVIPEVREDIKQKALQKGVSLRYTETRIVMSIDETHTDHDIRTLLSCFSAFETLSPGLQRIDNANSLVKTGNTLTRKSPFLSHPTFSKYQSETELLRYINHLQAKDLSLVHSMVPLGSCTMKLNATAEMIPVSWPLLSSLHPFSSDDQSKGYRVMDEQLRSLLESITGMDAVSLQPNSGAQGEFAGLKVIKKFHEVQGSGQKRNVCLIPLSAHGTNPASAAMAGMRVVPIKCDSKTGNLDLLDLQAKCEEHKEELAAIMVTYPSTFGVFEPKIKEVCRIVHEYGGQVYMDGANMNAQIGVCKPAEIGADVCHLNLHKTFCIPHGGGGPGVGPIAVKRHLQRHLPRAKTTDLTSKDPAKASSIPPVSSAPYGSASILPISLAYIMMMGPAGLRLGTSVALLNANYMMARLQDHYTILHSNDNGRCAHEFILDIRKLQGKSGIEAIDIAKRLQDFGFHAPTMSWPVPNTLMIEPTESETKEELDRYCDALISIRQEIAQIENGEQPREGNVLKMAPHTQQDLLRSDWERPYSREAAAYPLQWLREKKFWPSVTRIDDAFGDTNLFCTCPPVESFAQATEGDAENDLVPAPESAQARLPSGEDSAIDIETDEETDESLDKAPDTESDEELEEIDEGIVEDEAAEIGEAVKEEAEEEKGEGRNKE
ncbi:MAG: hypothetical protein Q9227_009279 [Pyrenula ochraceoflavens]